jgi:diphthine synthase
LNELVFVGLGLNDDKCITLQGLEETKTADSIFMESYTSLMPEFNLERFKTVIGKEISLIERQTLEEENGKKILQAAKVGKAVFLVPGDPFIATTHITLRIEAKKQGIETRIVHGISITSSIISFSGLHNYKFGKTVTIPFEENFSETPYNVIAQNKNLGLHTLCLLDIKATQKEYLTINQAIKILRKIEETKKRNVLTHETVALGIARAGSYKPTLKADFLEALTNFDFGEPPHSLIILGTLHFMEIEALISFADAPTKFKELG